MATIRQKKLAKILSENDSITAGQAMIKAGYSPISATKPNRVLENEEFKKLLNKYLPDKLLARAHKQAIKATRPHPHLPTQDIPDHQTRLRAVELGYKIKGKLQDTQHTLNVDSMNIRITEDTASKGIDKSTL